MNIEANDVALISACTALVASIAGPTVQLVIARRQIGANLISANRQRWIDALRDLISELISLLMMGAYIKQGMALRDETVMAANAQLLQKIERALLIKSKIRLLVNPNEGDHRALLDAIESPFARLWQQERTDVIAAVENDIESITRHAQGIFKREWARVKRGD